MEAYQALTQAKNLCGHTDTDRPWGQQGQERKATPSPIWIANHENYQVVTVFGATQEPRQGFKKSRSDSDFPDRLIQAINFMRRGSYDLYCG